jgi:hypothetical protein
MSRKLALLLAPVVLAIGLAVAARGQEPDNKPPAPSPAPKPGPYEYRVLQLLYSEYRDWPEWKEIVTKNGGNEVKSDAAFKEFVLNHYADQGWELVQVISPKNEHYVFYLRRAR